MQEEVDGEPAEEADVEEEPEEDTNGDDESEVADLKPRIQRPRSPEEGARAAETCQRLAHNHGNQDASRRSSPRPRLVAVGSRISRASHRSFIIAMPRCRPLPRPRSTSPVGPMVGLAQ